MLLSVVTTYNLCNKCAQCKCGVRNISASASMFMPRPCKDPETETHLYRHELVTHALHSLSTISLLPDCKQLP
jgi:hypothetical protein